MESVAEADKLIHGLKSQMQTTEQFFNNYLEGVDVALPQQQKNTRETISDLEEQIKKLQLDNAKKSEVIRELKTRHTKQKSHLQEEIPTIHSQHTSEGTSTSQGLTASHPSQVQLPIPSSEPKPEKKFSSVVSFMKPLAIAEKQETQSSPKVEQTEQLGTTTFEESGQGMEGVDLGRKRTKEEKEDIEQQPIATKRSKQQQEPQQATESLTSSREKKEQEDFTKITTKDALLKKGPLTKKQQLWLTTEQWKIIDAMSGGEIFKLGFEVPFGDREERQRLFDKVKKYLSSTLTAPVVDSIKRRGLPLRAWESNLASVALNDALKKEQDRFQRLTVDTLKTTKLNPLLTSWLSKKQRDAL
jgi:hypothetical protein